MGHQPLYGMLQADIHRNDHRHDLRFADELGATLLRTWTPDQLRDLRVELLIEIIRLPDAESPPHLYALLTRQLKIVHGAIADHR